MSTHDRATISRRAALQSSAAMLGGALVGGRAAASPEPQFQNVNTNSSPSTLKITDLRVATVVKPGPSPCTIVRIDTNQGVYGLGEVRDGASATYALMSEEPHSGRESAPHRLTSFEKIKQFGGHGAAGRRRGLHRNGALGYRGKGVWGPDLPDAGRQIPRQGSHLCRHHRVEGPQGLRPEHENSQGRNGPDVAEDGSGNRHGPRHPRHRDSAFGIERLGGNISPSPVRGDRGDRQGNRHALRVCGGDPRSRWNGNPAFHGPPRPHRREVLHPAGKGL